MFAKSIRWRLVAWQGLILAIVVAGFLRHGLSA